MTTIDLDTLEATARAATPGPWEHRAESPSMGGENYTIRQTGVPGIRMTGYVYGFGTGMIEHIATFDPPTVLALITRLREAEAVIENVQALLDTASDERGITWWEWIEEGLGGSLHDELRAVLKPTNQEENSDEH